MSDVEGVKERVQAFLASVGTVTIDRDGDFVVEAGSTRAFVTVRPHGNGEATVVVITAPVLLNVPLTPELYRHIAVNSSEYFFGHLMLIELEGKNTGLVLMRHTLLGDYLDKDELFYAVFGVASSADEVDDQLRAQFGGDLHSGQ